MASDEEVMNSEEVKVTIIILVFQNLIFFINLI